jgi:hypothetical protein
MGRAYFPPRSLDTSVTNFDLFQELKEQWAENISEVLCTCLAVTTANQPNLLAGAQELPKRP